MTRLTPTQRRVLDILAQGGYISHFIRSRRAVLWHSDGTPEARSVMAVLMTLQDRQLVTERHVSVGSREYRLNGAGRALWQQLQEDQHG